MTAKRRAPLPSPPERLLEQASLFLDFDGTIVEIASRPDAVKVEVRLQHLMSTLSTRLKDRIAIVSGRSAGQIRDLFGQPAFAISGSHGIELHWPDGRIITPAVDGQREAILVELSALERAHPGIIVEEKPFGIALHYRLAPHMENECWRLAKHIATLTGYSLQAGKMVVELVTAGANKGNAVQAFMRQPPMAGTRPVFIGDDDTDESGFLMAAQLGGVGVLVGAPRPTAATFGLANVDQTLRWLETASEFVS